MPYPVTVSSPKNDQTQQGRAEALAQKLNLSFSPDPRPEENGLVLYCTSNALSLYQFQGKRRLCRQVLFVDFLHGKNGYRLAHNRTIKQNLARAVGIKSGVRPTVFDATAGLGADAFVLASLGCKVFLCERNPVIAVLLADGIQRAATAPATRDIIARMVLIKGESREMVASTPCDTIYLDPMYPHTDSCAEKKGSMRILRQIAGDDIDGEKLMIAAEKGRAERITVKRPKKAPQISTKIPHHTLIGKSCRYDIYL